ncbi:unnamed protein product [Oppiella nova]|uniref:Inositol-pentakisphosphate 2-kinase n=1 Tax=Oppiella nova TaxID=334625 RepID=A0A7R9MHG7_9ACAR|nr:unnamed protein product [Oppiella nova]CAG2177471.1 unnamed protein product [Oppiella nova]
MLIPRGLAPQHCVQLELGDDSRLHYRGEGNTALVVAVSDVSDVIAEQTVIRLFKQTPDTPCERSANRIARQIQFVESVVARALSPAFHCPPRLAILSEDQIRAIDRLVRDKRPRFRLAKGIVTCGDTYALLLEDYCWFPTSLRRRGFATEGPVVCVEIKPKQGFLPKPEVLTDELKVKARVCRYCLKQFRKLSKRSIARRSQYCPLDLFSGCPNRTQTALRALADDPQNNFRVFRDGRHVFGDDTNSALPSVLRDFCGQSEADVLPALCRLLANALALRVDVNRKRAPMRAPAEECALHPHRCACNGGGEHALAVGSVLEAVLWAQRLDCVDSKLASEMLRTMSEKENNNFSHFSCPPNAKELVREDVPHESELESLQRKVYQFLVSLTAKDCSVMIAMQRLCAEEDVSRVPECHLLSDFGNKYLVSIRVTDLDEREPKKIERTLLKDRRMIRAYNSAQSLL